MTGSGSWPTATAGDARASGNRNLEGSKAHPGTSLTDAVKGGQRPRWPTPRACEGDHPPMGPRGRGLEQAVKQWPTPNAFPCGPDYARAGRPESGGDDLPTAVAREGNNQGQLNPDWVEWLMNFPIAWTSLDPLPSEAFAHWETAADWWDYDPADDPSSGITRIAKGIPNRIERLTGIGNGQVPPVVVAAWTLLGPA